MPERNQKILDWINHRIVEMEEKALNMGLSFSGEKSFIQDGVELFLPAGQADAYDYSVSKRMNKLFWKSF